MTNLRIDYQETFVMSATVSNNIETQTSSLQNTKKIAQSLKLRNAKERRFRFLGKLAIAFGFSMVIILFVDIAIHSVKPKC